MKKIVIQLFTVLIIFGCASPDVKENSKGPGITNTHDKRGFLSNDELIKNARNEAIISIEDHHLSLEQAKTILKEHLNLSYHDNNDISFEGMHDGEYGFHVSDFVQVNSQQEKLSGDWYKVNPETGEISLWKN
ncbi:hypothetical protein [Sutcliffiella rhizosphaerae]|uniref:Lipoprotein n=1 Tax=Sutcliffiella rhizosphaerae TaxID=2880967 RepID=A0ABM8YLA5_9BACI|nr:hypothetical protein [Sutcliffiella rhizosphaerae]CAG9620633.1 hypothetical protein BACCIP111883_01402 [Sutcliffiella rhizosphaerae]